MVRILAFLMAFCTPALLAAGGSSSAPPSDGAKGMCGAMGTVTYIPADWGPRLVVENDGGATSWWKDTDGIAPGVAGCHLGVDEDGKPNGRMFGEACLSEDLLVESNPGKDEVHSHGNDVGHPDTFSCSLWCKGQGSEGGVCQKAEAPPCKSSARCVCAAGE